MTGIKINTPENFRVDVGTALDGAVLKELGVTAQIVWQSGKTDGDIDLSNAKLFGYDAETQGEQEVTVRITVNGASVTGKFTVTVGSSSSGFVKCSSDVTDGLLPIGFAALAVAAFVCLRKKERN